MLRLRKVYDRAFVTRGTLSSQRTQLLLTPDLLHNVARPRAVAQQIPNTPEFLEIPPGKGAQSGQIGANVGDDGDLDGNPGAPPL